MSHINSSRLEEGMVMQERYKIVRFLGRGGMGFVYLCEDLRLSGKTWALKEMILHDPGIAEQVKESFVREARFLAGLRHRSLPTIVDFFSHKRRQYLVLEFIEGETLASRIEREGVPTDTVALSWALELAQVLDYLHRQERPIIFRDLKPENIMINHEGHIKVIDFGLARHFEEGKHRDTQASGTLGYAPPEQWEDSSQSDPRSDIYSLAATLFFILTGKPPSPVYGNQKLKPYRPDIDPGIESLVLKCLEPKPEARYSSAAELIKDLLLLLSDEKHQGAMHRVESEQRNNRPPPVLAPRRSSGGSIPALGRPVPFPKGLPSLLGVGLVLFLMGLLLPFVNLERSYAKGPVSQDQLTEILAQTDTDKKTAQSLMDKGQYEEAIALLDSLFTRYPEDPESLILKNNAYAEFSGLEHYKIPVLSSWHGSEREGVQLLYGFGLAQTELNQARIGKEPLIILDLHDDRSNNETLLSTAKAIASDEESPLIVGPFTSQQTRLIAPIANSEGLPTLAPIASDPQVLATGRYIFSAADTDTQKIGKLANFMYRSGARKVAIFSNSSSIISRSWGDNFLEAFQKEGGLIAVNDTYPDNQVDFASQVAEAREQGADCIFLAEYRVSPVLNFCESLKRVEWKPMLSVQTAAFSDSLFRRGEDLVEGMLLATYYVPGVGNARAKSFARDFRQTFAGRRPTHREVFSYDSLYLVVDALDKVGADREAIQSFLAGFGDSKPAYQGVSGKFAVARTLGQRTTYILQVQKGAYRLVETEAAEGI